MALERSLICTDNHIQQAQWFNCLSKLDDDIRKLQDESSELIIISMPSSINMIKQSIEESLSIEFPNDCIDIMKEYLTPDKKSIQKRILSEENSLHQISKWTPNKHDQLISTQAIIIINRTSSEFKSIPRNISAFIPIKWYATIETLQQLQIYSIIGNNIANLYLPNNFKLKNDWSHKVDFSDTLHVCYLCDDNYIVCTRIVKQNSFSSKIFITLENRSDVEHFGKQYGWIAIPNHRLFAPRKTVSEKLLKERNENSFYSVPKQTRKRKRSVLYEEDEDLLKAMGDSMGYEYKKHKDNDYDLRIAMMASMNEEYLPKGIIEDKNNNHNRNEVGTNENYIDFKDEEDDLQRA
eukprot:372200_1